MLTRRTLSSFQGYSNLTMELSIGGLSIHMRCEGGRTVPDDFPVSPSITLSSGNQTVRLPVYITSTEITFTAQLCGYSISWLSLTKSFFVGQSNNCLLHTGEFLSALWGALRLSPSILHGKTWAGIMGHLGASAGESSGLSVEGLLQPRNVLGLRGGSLADCHRLIQIYSEKPTFVQAQHRKGQVKPTWPSHARRSLSIC